MYIKAQVWPKFGRALTQLLRASAQLSQWEEDYQPERLFYFYFFLFLLLFFSSVFHLFLGVDLLR